MYSQATQFCSSAMADARSDLEMRILGRNEVFLLLINQFMLLVMLMNPEGEKLLLVGWHTGIHPT